MDFFLILLIKTFLLILVLVTFQPTRLIETFFHLSKMLLGKVNRQYYNLKKFDIKV